MTDYVNLIQSKASEIEKSFSYDDYSVVRREFFSHAREPMLTVWHDCISFSSACINGFSDAEYVQVLFSENLRRIAVRKCSEDDKDALRWCKVKNGKRKSRKIICREFSKRLFEFMGWSSAHRFKMLGHRITYNNDALFVFELDDAERFIDIRKKELTKNSSKSAASSYKTEFPESWGTGFGIPFNEHRNIGSEGLERLQPLNIYNLLE